MAWWKAWVSGEQAGAEGRVPAGCWWREFSLVSSRTVCRPSTRLPTEEAREKKLPQA